MSNQVNIEMNNKENVGYSTIPQEPEIANHLINVQALKPFNQAEAYAGGNDKYNDSDGDGDSDNDNDNENNKNKKVLKDDKMKENSEEEIKKLYIGSGKPASIIDLYVRFLDKCDIFYIILAIVGSLGTGISMPLFAIIFGGTLTDFGPKNTIEQVRAGISEMVNKFLIIGAAMFIAAFMSSTFWIYTSMKNLTALKKMYFRIIMKQEQGWFDQNNPYQFSTLVQNQIKTIEHGLGDKLGNVLMALSMFVSGIIVAFITSWKLTLVLVSLLPLMVIGVVYVSKAIRSGSKKASDAYTRAGGVSEEVLYQIKTVASFANFDYEIKRYNTLVEFSRDVSIKNGFKTAIGIGFVFLVLFSTYCLAIWYGSTLIYHDEMNSNSGKKFSGGDVMTVLLSFIMAGVSLGMTAPNIKAISEASIAASDLFELKERKNEITMLEPIIKPPKERIQGLIQFKNVDFYYPKSPNVKVIDNLTLTFTPGKKTAIVGESGSGKSTIVNLIERLYDATQGEIIIDGINIKQFDIFTLRSYIGYVQQEPVLFNQSIRDNLIFGREGITEEMIKDACRESLADEFISKIPEGLDFVVGIKGKNLSGGQKQRLAIARAILTKPTILILDEATSALDNRNEKMVQLSLDRVSKNVTTIVIAHRLTTIINADTIVAMKQGTIVEMGPHQELLAKGEYYSLLFKSQAADENADRHEEDIHRQNQDVNAADVNELVEPAAAYAKPITQDAAKLNKPQTSNLNENLNNRVESHVSYKSEQESEVYSVSRIDETGEQKRKKQEIEDRVKRSKKKLFTYLSNSKGTIAAGMLAAAVNGSVFPIYGLVLAIAIDILSSPIKQVVRDDGFFMSMMFLVIAGAAGIATFLQNYLFTRIGEILCQNLRSDVFKKYLKMHIAFFDKPENSPGSLITRLSSDTTKLNGIVLSMIGVSIQSAVNLIIGLALGFSYDWRLTLIALGCIPFMVFAGLMQQKMRKGFIEEDDQLDIEAGSLLSECVINTKTIFSFNMQMKVADYYEAIICRGASSIIKQSIITGFSMGLSNFITFVINAVILYAGGTFITQGTLTFGNMIKSMFSILFAASGLSQAQQYVGDYGKAKVALDSLFKVIEAESTIDPLDQDEKHKKDASQVKGKIEFKHVWFAYPTRKDQKVLKNVSFVIQPGQNVAFTGFSGSGKSTIIQLIERFYDADKGEILIDDVNIKEYNIVGLRKRIGIVMQEPNIFKRNVAENIEYGNLGADFESIVEAAKKANIGKFFTKGQRGEKDDNVSGGQKQRISIARAILKNPRILLLDEATSALDKRSEERVQKAIDNASLNRTTITVAHRLSTIEKCDIIFVLNLGRIYEQGTHSELLSKKGLYWKQYNCSD